MFRHASLIVAFVAALLPAAALAQAFPTRAVKIMVPYAAGAPPTVFTRAVADKLAKLWGQPVIVEPRPGASGFLAIEAVKTAPADGHDLLLAGNAHMAINPSLYRKLPYDPDRDFVPVAMLYHTPFYLAVAASGPYSNVPALVEAAKARPGSVSYASNFVGSPSHLGGAEFEWLTGTKLIHVPYKDQTQIFGNIANGDVSFVFTTLGSALPLLQAGRIKLLAVGAASRTAGRPDVPTLAEAGGPPAMRVGAWIAIVAPRGTPAETVRKLNADFNRVLADPDIAALLANFGFDASPGTPEQLAAEIRTDAKKYAELVRRTGATAE